MTKKRITVDLKLSWTFDEKEWSDEKDHIQAVRDNPKLVLGYDIIHSLFCLNELTTPNLKDIKAYAAND